MYKAKIVLPQKEHHFVIESHQCMPTFKFVCKCSCGWSVKGNNTTWGGCQLIHYKTVQLAEKKYDMHHGYKYA